jgi:hypothetical protein
VAEQSLKTAADETAEDGGEDRSKRTAAE